jgi:hypothetical protein
MFPRERTVTPTWEDSSHETVHHFIEVGNRERRLLAYPPKVQLMWCAAVKTVDGIPSVDDASTYQQHVIAWTFRNSAQSRWDHRRRVRSKHDAVTDVPGVSGISGHCFRRDAEPVVVVGDRYDRVGADSTDFTSPRLQRLHSLIDDELDGVRSVLGVGEITNRQVAAKLLKGEC